jgi:hypothetical protein
VSLTLSSNELLSVHRGGYRGFFPISCKLLPSNPSKGTCVEERDEATTIQISEIATVTIVVPNTSYFGSLLASDRRIPTILTDRASK